MGKFVKQGAFFGLEIIGQRRILLQKRLCIRKVLETLRSPPRRVTSGSQLPVEQVSDSKHTQARASDQDLDRAGDRPLKRRIVRRPDRRAFRTNPVVGVFVPARLTETSGQQRLAWKPPAIGESDVERSISPLSLCLRFRRPQWAALQGRDTTNGAAALLSRAGAVVEEAGVEPRSRWQASPPNTR